MEEIDNTSTISLNGTGVFLKEFYELLEECLSEIGLSDDDVSPEDAKSIAISMFFNIKNKY